jgi:HD-GYP domain-containing protein (c-di-GMP phosphodiesterase class II)
MLGGYSSVSQPASTAAHKPGSLPDKSEMMTIAVADLPVGRRLQCPIYDPQQVLLIAAGSIVTSRSKQLLESRGVREVLVSPADATVTAPGNASALSGRGVAQFDAGIANRLDELVDSGRLFNADSGPAFRDRLQQRGCQSYSHELRETLVARHAETCSAVDGLIKAAVHGEPLNGETIAAIVADYLTDLITDVDCVLETARRAGDYSELAGHCLQMSLLGMAIGIEMGLGEDDLRQLGFSGLLHDWGMALVDPRIRHATHVLSRSEFIEVQKHPIYTLEILKSASGIPRQVPMICYQVHERPNGTGYPRGRRRDTIHPSARILQVADSYLALTSPRSFRLPLMPHAAMECLLREATDNLVDGDVFRALLKILSLFPIGSVVQLSDGSTARVLRRNGNNYHSPIVVVMQDASGDPTDPLDESQIIDPSKQNLKIAKVLPDPNREEIGLTTEIQVLKRS